MVGCDALNVVIVVRIHGPEPWPHRLAAEDSWFSTRRRGFDSPWGYQNEKPRSSRGFSICNGARVYLNDRKYATSAFASDGLNSNAGIGGRGRDPSGITPVSKNRTASESRRNIGKPAMRGVRDAHGICTPGAGTNGSRAPIRFAP